MSSVRPDECLVCGGEKDSGRAWVCGLCRSPYARTASRRRQARRRYRLRIAHAYRVSRAVTTSEHGYAGRELDGASCR